MNDGDLEIIIVMQNGGLPEAGDCVLSLPHSYLKDSTSIGRWQTCLLRTRVANRSRRTRSAERICRWPVLSNYGPRVEQEGPQALDEFYRSAAALTHDQLEEWRELWHNGAERAVATTGDQLRALESVELAHLQDGALREANPRPGSPRPGMCGRITNFDPAIVQVATTKLA